MKTISFSRTHFVQLLAALALAFGALTLPSGSARATATYTVNSSNDPGDGTCDGAECTLREAIDVARRGNIIHFANDYTILLQKSGLTIDKDLTIDGTGHTVIVSGGGNVLVFSVNSGSTVNLNDLTITQGTGTYGGGISNNGILNLTNSTVSASHASNDGGGIYNSSSGTFTITNSTLSGNSAEHAGGGFENTGTATITNSTFSTNSSFSTTSADWGGGLDNFRANITITNSTFSGNSAIFGGGLRNNDGTVTIANSTFSSNSADVLGGGIYNDGTVTVTNSTFSPNSAGLAGGGIYNNTGTATLRNTILANSISGGNCSGSSITDGGGNLVWGDSTCPGINADPKLSALGSYGGSTQTFALLPGSAAINTGIDSTCSAAPVNRLDQRGVARPSACDIGAFESRGFTLAISGGSVQSAVVNTAFTTPLAVSISSASGEPVNGGTVTFTKPGSGASAVITGSPAAISGGQASVTAAANNNVGSYNVNADTSGASAGVDFALQNTCGTSSISVTNNLDSGDGSLRQAIANVCAGGTITFAGNYTIYLSSQLVIYKSMTIDGSGHTVTVSGDTDHDGSGNVRVFNLSTVTFNLNNLTVTKGYAVSDQGGGIETHTSGTTVTITNSTFSDNSARYGGGIDNYGSMIITNSTFSGNSAYDYSYGGGINNSSSGTLTITNSTFSGNSAAWAGSIYNYAGTVTLRNTIVANSTGGNCGGTITDGGGNLVWGDNTCPGINADPKLSALGSYSGPTQTFALLPGSAAINAGNAAICSAAPVNGFDQRGVVRPSACDIGAFESGGFSLAVSGGNNQSAATNTAFSNPLVVGVSSSSGEPVNGGTVTFTPPGAGASAVINGSPAAISGGLVSVTATANDILGSYNVNASTSGAIAGVDFALQNTCGISIIVTNSNDNGTGSLRQAITSLCAGGTITFAGNYTIHLANQLTIGKNMIIDGTGHAVIVSGDGNVLVFSINSGYTVNLNALTITQGTGTYGGGIFNDGILNLTNSTVSASHASNDGGGVYNSGSGTLTITNSTLSGNSADNAGGGFENVGTATLANNTFSTNSAAFGSGLDNYLGNITITNSTFSGNSADYDYGDSLSNNGDGTVTLRNTIVANSLYGVNCSGGITDGGGNLVWGDNTCPGINADPKLSALGNYGGSTQTFALLPGSAAINAGSAAICSAAPVNGLDQRGVTRPSACDIGAFESGGFSLTVSSGSGQSAVINSAFTNPLVVGVSSASGEPVNGGTVAFTPPASGASAVITGNPATISGGQAQVSAAANENVGSYNVNANTSLAGAGVDFSLQNYCNPTSIVANSNNDGSGSLRQAISGLCVGGTITFAGDTTIHLASTLTIDKNLTIAGVGHTVTVSGDTNSDGTGDVRVFYVNSGVTFNLNNLIVTKGNSTFGGGIDNEGGIVTITNSTFSGNSATWGGGIANFGTLTITNSTFSGNSADYSGGVYNAGTLTITSSTLSGNSAVNSGGGILNQGTATITNSTFSGNSARYGGGGFNDIPRTLTITNSTFSGNNATLAGGIYNNGARGIVRLRNTLVAGNPSGGNCGGIITDGGGNLVWGDNTCPGINTDPKLGSLASNGGPTRTFALLPGSAAIDAGNDTICAATAGNPNYGAGGLDQRGIARPQGAHCDIGAFEMVQYTISGNAGVSGATLSYTDGSAKTAAADSSGHCSFTVSYNWSGTITPSKPGYTFAPTSISVTTPVTSNLTGQDFTATLNFYWIYLPLVIR